MRSDIKENLETLSKEQLIYIIDKFDHLYCTVSEICVSESKLYIESKEAVSKIRKQCYDIQFDVDIADENISDYINMKLGKITPAEYRKIVLEIDKDENDG